MMLSQEIGYFPELEETAEYLSFTHMLNFFSLSNAFFFFFG